MADQERITESEFSQTVASEAAKPKGKGGRTRRAPDVGLWAVRGVDLETRALIEKAATRAGKTIGQYVNEDVRSLAQSQLTQTQLPASPKDMQDQIEHLTRIVEGIASRMPEQGKKTFWQRLFG